MIKERKRTYTQEEVNELKKWFDSCIGERCINSASCPFEIKQDVQSQIFVVNTFCPILLSSMSHGWLTNLFLGITETILLKSLHDTGLILDVKLTSAMFFVLSNK